jgi:hypothetical protein
MQIRQALALAAIVGGTTQCSLLAPSDAELMGGAHPDDGGSSGDAASEGDAPAWASVDGGDAGGISCTPQGGFCVPSKGTCCSNSCIGHTCQ